MASRPATPAPPAAAPDIFAARGWLSDHPAAFRAAILGAGVPVAVTPGRTVYREGDSSSGLFGIISGAMGVEGGHGKVTPRLGHILRDGEWFGIKAPLHGGPRELTYRAIEPTRLLFIANARLRALMEDNVDAAIRIGQLAEIGNRLGAWITRDLLTRDAGQRVAAALLRVLGSGELAPVDPAGFRLTQQMLAEMANLSRNHVCRKLGEFEAAGWIAWGYNRIRLLDADGLAAFAYGDEGG
jgi:CRP-like cAMP-binding protein